MSEEATKQKAVTSETFIYLSLWFILNIVITVYSKVIFSVHEFPYSFLMTAIHMAVTMTGVATGFATGFFKARAQLSGESLLKLVQFSFVFTLNIWLSNAALNAVSIEMHQVVRSLVPIATMVISLLLYNKAYSWSLLPSVAMICGGVILTVSGAPSVEASGLAITVASLFMASVKGIMTQQMQVGDLGLSAPELLLYMSPMALVELLVAAEVSGEISSLIESGGVSSTLGWHLFGVGLVACALNVVSFRSAGLATPLTMNVLSNIKQVLTCVLGVILFNGGFTLGLSAGE
uniref:Sugar phosphate transporter domain-containing protein n=1 Tax=Chromera velia CCMP2878 TaxID=1169474 RepID=A0A0G4GJR9_9ALVE|eukprot:Cvel_22203.t1-p1 / transcript=Cvel_22203.t1 / gene=Cvel_22203 / organism=Chromera_velia_CCMP2878 / gene_product=Probable sugar phosphate/phosphate translocator, putative / transcript_product=Probable sugar phosphate/phosphate translocator, putative / location=Cvel_scaffold2157:263-5467(-) / protein_length=290 / sequence_SO=supercontig / SO=protein_coding / is_pseudo=false